MNLSTPKPGTGATEFAWDVNTGREGGWGNRMGQVQEQISLLLKPLPMGNQAELLWLGFYCFLKVPPKDQRSNINRQFTLIMGNRNLETWSDSLKSFKILFWLVSFLLLAWT